MVFELSSKVPKFQEFDAELGAELEAEVIRLALIEKRFPSLFEEDDEVKAFGRVIRWLLTWEIPALNERLLDSGIALRTGAICSDRERLRLTIQDLSSKVDQILRGSARSLGQP